MLMKLQGWQRQTTTHHHPVSQVVKRAGSLYPKAGSAPLKWHKPFTARGKVEDLALTGAFLVTFEFTPEDLRSWLETLVKMDPQYAARILGEMHTEAMIQLSKPKDETG